jgi:YVTN family beta-propeller protein
MEFRILGPLEVTDGGRQPAIAASKQRALLAILLLHANEVVSSDRLIEELWGERPPASAAKSLQVYVSRLRHALEDAHVNGADGVIVTRGGGYLVRVGPGELDLASFERLLEEGSDALAEGAPGRAQELLREALALWRGPPLAEFAYEPFAQEEIARLDELHLTAVELRIEAGLALGEHARLIGELETLVKRHPFRERLRAQLMLALYRAGRQTEALQAYQRARRTLVDEVGVEPGEQLRELERAILAQDPALDAPAAAIAAPRQVAPTGKPPGGETPQHRRGLGWVPATALFLLAAVAGIVVLLVVGLGDDGGVSALLTRDSHAVAVIDPATNELTEALSVGTRPGSLAFDRESGSLWVANVDDETVTQIDPRRRSVGRTIPIGGLPTGLAAGNGSLWVASVSRQDVGDPVTVHKINARFNTVDRTLRVGNLAGDRPQVTLGEGLLWVAPQFGLVTRVDPRDASIKRPAIDPGHNTSGIAVGGGAVWLAGGEAGAVTRVDVASGHPTPIPVGNGPGDIAVGSGGVWVALALDDTLARIDPQTGVVEETIAVGRSPAGVAVGAGSVWVANSGDGTVSRIDPQTNEVAATIPVGASPQDVTVAAGRVWVSVRPRTLTEAKLGGTLRIELAEGPKSLDPALGWFNTYEIQLAYATGARLLNYPDAPAPAGSRPEPEVAESLPSRSRDGKTYTFTIRKGFRFSPPSREPVSAQTFKYTIERALSPKLNGPAGLYVSDIAGTRDYVEGRVRHIAGISASGDKLRIQLTRPAGDFPTRIALPFFAAVPTNTPIDPGLGKVPSAGPYYVAAFDRDEGVLLKRNPNYRGSRPRRPRQIRFTPGISRARAAAHVEGGSADFSPGIEHNGSLPQAPRLARRYGPGSDAAKAGRQRYFINPLLEVDQIALNTSRPLFSSTTVRQAVNYAIDRRALARQGGLELKLPSRPTDRYLPPGMPGFEDARLYPLRPNLAKARRLAGGERRTAVLYAYDRPPAPQLAEIVKSNLKAIGIDVEVKLFAKGVLFERAARKDEPYDMLMNGWFVDYADPADFLSQLDGRTLDEDSYLSGAFLNLARFDDPAFNRRLIAAERLAGPRRYSTYSRIERDMVRDGAPWAAFGNETSHDFFSARIGCQVYQPVYGIDLGALCIRR